MINEDKQEEVCQWFDPIECFQFQQASPCQNASDVMPPTSDLTQLNVCQQASLPVVIVMVMDVQEVIQLFDPPTTNYLSINDKQVRQWFADVVWPNCWMLNVSQRKQEAHANAVP